MPLLIALACLAACAGGRSGTPTPAPTVPEPVLSDVPPGTVIDLDRAAELYHEGDAEGALVIYSAAAKNGNASQKQLGLLAVARIQNEQGNHANAARTVQAFRATGPSADQDRQALLLLGSAQFAQGDFDAARAALQEYVQRGGPAWPYAQVYLAQIDARTSDFDSAVNRIGQALSANLPAGASYDAQMTLAGIQVQARRSGDAIAAYQAAADVAPTAAKAAEALSLLADIATAAHDDSAAAGALESIVANYPITDEALSALDDPRIKSDANVTALQRATVLLNHRLNDEAIAAFQAIVDGGGADVPQAEYDLGILSERAEDWNGAIDHYDAAINALAPGVNDALRAQASWDKGTVYENIGLTSNAVDAYAAVSGFDSSAERAPEGLFRAGFLSYNLGRTEDALVYFGRYRDSTTIGEDRARADYWSAAASAQLNDYDSQSVYLQAAAGDDQLDYYGMRAAARLAGETALPAALTVTPPAPSWTRYETWLTGWAGPEDTAATSALFAGEPWLRAVDLDAAGLTDRADQQFRVLLNDNAHDAWLVYRLVRAIGDYDRPWITSPAAATLLNEPDAPPEALQLEYPLEYFALVQEDAAANNISPLLLLALVRQESLYDPSAVSSANAMGLTQVIPSTARGIAEELGVDGFQDSDLLRAGTSLQFGAHYLGGVVAGFGGQLPPAVAGYNAGPGTSAGWWDAAGQDPDLFLETIPYVETRTFVEVVLENYARYLYAYGVADAPALPLP
ncbi:MAG TPA: transglycosylase SLT domain-containing protein [Dehalococcoidia bacterium]|nr:transglycosylase SLT domain-containing protein [Dehalococcoidia bacterium]